MLLVNGAVKKFGMCYFRTVLFLVMLGGEDLRCLVLILYIYPCVKKGLFQCLDLQELFSLISA